MKVNTLIIKKFIDFINSNNNSTEYKPTIKNIIDSLQDSIYNTTLIDIEKPLIIEYTKKHLKPNDLKELYKTYNSNLLYFITCIKDIDNKFRYYQYVYDGQKTKEEKLFNFCYYTYTTEAKNRAAADTTIIITQHSKYYYELDKKRQNRKNYYNYFSNRYNNIRYIFKKDFYNEYSIPEEKQRYKYVVAGYEKITLVSNILKSCEYHFNFNNTRFNPELEYIEIDKSGYITTYKKEELKKEAKRLKEKRLDTAFKENKKDYYIKLLENDINNINDLIRKSLAAGSTSGIENFKTIHILLDKTETIKKDIFNYIEKLHNNTFYKGYLNTSIIDFENTIINLHTKATTENIINSLNDYINFKNLYNYIKLNYDNNYDFENFLENLGYKYVCLENCYSYKLHTYNNNYMCIGSYKIYMLNYFDFMQV